MTTQPCNNCKQPFEINPMYPNNKLCRTCYKELKSGYNNTEAKPKLDKEKQPIAMMAVWKGLTQLRPKNIKIDTIIEESKKVYDELFEQ